MDEASKVDPEMRFRFSSPHPKDFPDDLLHLIAERPNLCNYIHIPAQAGSDTMLERMRRPYTREGYLELIEKMKEIIPGVSLSTDIIAGFCDETEEEHKQTLSLMAEVEYDLAYMFAYSERERTLAARKFEDNVPEDVKKRRLSEIITQQRDIQERRNKEEVGRRHLVLVESTSKKSDDQLSGRTDTNKMVVFDRKDFKPGDYVEVEVTDTTSATLIADPIRKTTLTEYYGAEVVA
jgi:tRNA-2-methylthio-N6-dimethylallyladenosine synthase